MVLTQLSYQPLNEQVSSLEYLSVPSGDGKQLLYVDKYRMCETENCKERY